MMKALIRGWIVLVLVLDFFEFRISDFGFRVFARSMVQQIRG